jgi:NADH:ubiquinone oxidoreductase subunit C
MIQQIVSLTSVINKLTSISVTLKDNAVQGIRIANLNMNSFALLNALGFSVYDVTASNHPDRNLSNTMYYMYETLTSSIYMTHLAIRKGTVFTASRINAIASVAERECHEMFGLFYESHPDLRKLLLDYGSIINPLLKEFPLPGYMQIAYSQWKGIIFIPIALSQALRDFKYIQPWVQS